MKFKLGQRVKLLMSERTGVISGTARWMDDMDPNFMTKGYTVKLDDGIDLHDGRIFIGSLIVHPDNIVLMEDK